MNKIIEKLKEIQEETDPLIKDDKEAEQVYNMLSNVIYKLEDIHEEQTERGI